MPCKTSASKAHIDEAGHGRDELVLFFFAQRFSRFQFGPWAIIDVRTGRLADGGLLDGEKQFRLCHASRSNPGANLQPVVIGLIVVEVAAMSILAWLGRHGDLSVDVIALRWLHPPINLDIDSKRQSQVYNVE